MIINLRGYGKDSGAISGVNSFFDYRYTGDASFNGNLREDWAITFLNSGTFTINDLGNTTAIDIFLVGGGANGGDPYTESDSLYGTGTNYLGGVGGGSGYTTTIKNLQITTGTYEIVVGGASEATSAFGHSAEGGNGQTGKRNGGNSVAGGYKSGGVWYTKTADSGEDGEYAFGESDFVHALSVGYKFAASGGGGAGTDGTTIKGQSGKGGKSGGGAGAGLNSAGGNATANSGAGGGGAGGKSGTPGKGGSGIVIIRNARG